MFIGVFAVELQEMSTNLVNNTFLHTFKNKDIRNSYYNKSVL